MLQGPLAPESAPASTTQRDPKTGMRARLQAPPQIPKGDPLSDRRTERQPNNEWVPGSEVRRIPSAQRLNKERRHPLISKGDGVLKGSYITDGGPPAWEGEHPERRQHFQELQDNLRVACVSRTSRDI